jgi:hypothetical protein
MMQKEGNHSLGYFHNLAHRLLGDPREEIKGALEEAASKSWRELHGKEESSLEAEVREVKVQRAGLGADYRTTDTELIANYRGNEYNISTGREDDQPEMEYAFNANVGWHKAKVEYEQQMQEDIRASVLKSVPRATYKDGKSRIAAETYRLVNRFLTFILWDIAAATI